MNEALVTGHVDDPRFDAVIEAQVREAEVERNAAAPLFFPGSVPVSARTNADLP